MPAITEFDGVVSSASRKDQCTSTSPAVPRPLLRRRRERSEPERSLVLAVRQEAKAKSPVSPDEVPCKLFAQARSILGLKGVLALSFRVERA